MLPLHGIGVLVTRPEQQAMPLCRLLEAQGASTYRLPAIEIKALGGRRELAARLGTLQHFDLIIFMSANAVRYGAALLGEQRGLNLAAVGPATARALNQAGYRVAIQPSQNYDSESLLAQPSLTQPLQRRILLIRGINGRDLLAQELAQRGAVVEVAEVYRRKITSPDCSTLAALVENFAAGYLKVVVANSLESVKNLLQLATPALRLQFDAVHWLLPSQRVAAGARKLQLQAPLLVAESAQDQDLVMALIRWRSKVSGA